MEFENKIVLRVVLFVLPLFIFAIRLMVVLPSTNSPQIKDKVVSSLPQILQGSNVMIFLGSGGHTGEMMKILNNVDISGLNRTWVISSSDTTSILKCKDFELSIKSDYKPQFLTLHRARSVGEPLLSSIKNTIISFFDALTKIWNLPELPSVLLVNGPGTSIPIAYILFTLKFLGFCNTRIVYIESLARVHELSLTGKLILPIANRFLVQWASVGHKYKRAEYLGILV